MKMSKFQFTFYQFRLENFNTKRNFAKLNEKVSISIRITKFKIKLWKCQRKSLNFKLNFTNFNASLNFKWNFSKNSISNENFPISTRNLNFKWNLHIIFSISNTKSLFQRDNLNLKKINENFNWIFANSAKKSQIRMKFTYKMFPISNRKSQ